MRSTRGRRSLPPGQSEVPGKGSPVVNFRIPANVLAAAKERAAAEGTTLNAVVVHALRRYSEGATANLNPLGRD